RPSVQPYMMSWLQYDPRAEIAKLEKPVLIVQGTTDIQVGVVQAELLAAANSEANLIIIEGMNHILKDAPAERAANIQTYTDPELLLQVEPTHEVTDFLRGLD